MFQSEFTCKYKFECLKTLVSIIWKKAKIHSLNRIPVTCLSCEEWMNIHNKANKIFLNI
jgi:hypothetical protein